MDFLGLLRIVVFVIADLAITVGIGYFEHTNSERWKVKTLGDAFVVTGVPIPTTIAEQNAMPAPFVDESTPRLPSEHTLYTLTARIVEASLEVDGDYHLVLEDPTNELRMVAEIPDGTSPGPEQYRKEFLLARRVIDHLIGPQTGAPGSSVIIPVNPPLVEITGIGFFDEPHLFTPQGMSPNCREIHPVLEVIAK
jgi:hypothetical protein